MSEGKINLYQLGVNGVDLTRSVVHAEDGTLRQAQNAVPDIRGEFGGLAKRDGLTAINSSSAGGSVAGVVMAPLFGKGGTNAGIKAFLGKESSNAGLFATSTDFFATTASEFPNATDEILPSDAYDDIASTRTWTKAAELGAPSRACVYDNKVYFVYSEDATPITNADPPTQIHVIDGNGDRRFFTRMPVNPDVGVESKGILALLANESYIYAGVWDTGTTSANVKGSVYRVNPDTGVCEKLGATFPTGYLPACLVWYQGKLWAGTYSDDTSFSGRVYWIRPGIDSSWTLDHTTTAGQGEVFALASYKGKLYAAVGGSNTLAGLVKVRATDGTWSTSLTGAATTADQYFLGLCVFNDNLYASYFDNNGGGTRTTTFHKFDNSSWSTVHTAAANRYGAYRLSMIGDNAYMIAANCTNVGLFTTTDGSSWTDRTTEGGGVTHLSTFAAIGV